MNTAADRLQRVARVKEELKKCLEQIPNPVRRQEISNLLYDLAALESSLAANTLPSGPSLASAPTPFWPQTAAFLAPLATAAAAPPSVPFWGTQALGVPVPPPSMAATNAAAAAVAVSDVRLGAYTEAVLPEVRRALQGQPWVLPSEAALQALVGPMVQNYPTVPVEFKAAVTNAVARRLWAERQG